MPRVYYPDIDPEIELAPQPPYNPERCVWLAIIVQAMHDLEHGTPPSWETMDMAGSDKYTDPEDFFFGAGWLREHFERVCANAGVSIEAVRKSAREVMRGRGN